MNLLSLCISSITPNNYEKEYFIGLFKSADEVNEVIKRLSGENGKFSEPNYKAKIQEIEVIGESDNIERVYSFYGQNIDSSLDSDIIESPYYTDKSTAIQELIKAKKNTPRQNWNLETHIVGRSNY